MVDRHREVGIRNGDGLAGVRDCEGCESPFRIERNALDVFCGFIAAVGAYAVAFALARRGAR